MKNSFQKISSTALKTIPNGDAVRDTILKQGMKATEASAYFWGNATKAVQYGAIGGDAGCRSLGRAANRLLSTQVGRLSIGWQTGERVALSRYLEDSRRLIDRRHPV